MSAEIVALPGSRDRASRGIKSVETGGKVLSALCASPDQSDLKALALRAGVQPSLAHAYLTSFVRLGLVRQDAASKRYSLGARALELGMAALGMLDPIEQALQVAGALRRELGLMVALTVWGDHGPTVIRVERSDHPLHLTLYEGAVLPIHETATGRLFCAFLPPAVVRAPLRTEAARLRGREGAAGLIAEFRAALPEVRARGMVRMTDRPVPGVQTLGAPVFDYTGAIVCAILVVGLAGSFDDRWDGAVAQALQRHAQALSGRMGYAVAGVADAGAA